MRSGFAEAADCVNIEREKDVASDHNAVRCFEGVM
jgi:hypothetical protein